MVQQELRPVCDQELLPVRVRHLAQHEVRLHFYRTILAHILNLCPNLRFDGRKLGARIALTQLIQLEVLT